MDSIDELAKKRREKAIKSINWEALQHGYAQSFDEEKGIYTGAEDFVEKKNNAINSYLENKKKL